MDMEYGNIAGLDKPVSKLVFGCAIEPMLRGENVDELLDAVYAQGITAFDTAENYGLSEVSLGNWIQKRKLRDKIVVISKGCHPYERDRVTPEDLVQDIEQSFRRLGTDYLDVYLLHRDNTALEPGPVIEVLNEYHRAGKIGIFGGSNWTYERIAQANAYAAERGLEPFRISSPNFSLCRQVKDPFGGGSGCVTLTGPDQTAARSWYVKQNMPVLAYSSLGRGMLSGRVKSDDPEGAKQFLDEYAQRGFLYPENLERLARAEKLAEKKGCSVPQIGLAWLFCQEISVYPVVSARSASRIRDNARAFLVQLTKEEADWLDLQA